MVIGGWCGGMSVLVYTIDYLSRVYSVVPTGGPRMYTHTRLSVSGVGRLCIKRVPIRGEPLHNSNTMYQ